MFDYSRGGYSLGGHGFDLLDILFKRDQRGFYLRSSLALIIPLTTFTYTQRSPLNTFPLVLSHKCRSLYHRPPHPLSPRSHSAITLCFCARLLNILTRGALTHFTRATFPLLHFPSPYFHLPPHAHSSHRFLPPLDMHHVHSAATLILSLSPRRFTPRPTQRHPPTRFTQLSPQLFFRILAHAITTVLPS